MRGHGEGGSSPDEALMEEYLSGARLVGDDFDAEQIATWYRDEEEAYADLGAVDRSSYRYGYHALNQAHGFRFVAGRNELRVLGLGSAYAEELQPLAGRLKSIVVVEPSEMLRGEAIGGVAVDYRRPDPSGRLPFPAGSFDLATCFGTLHHVPNVSFVLGELGRILRPGGHLLLREPIVNMGDWRDPRPGLTARERGIPLHHLLAAAERGGFEVIKTTPCIFPPLIRSARKLGLGAPLNSRAIVFLDGILSRLTFFSHRYDRSGPLRKATATSVFCVCRRLP